MKVARILIRFLAVVSALVLLALAYLHVFGFPQFLSDLVVRELRKAGYAAQFGSIRFDVIRGIVAKDAVFADARARGQPLARIDELELKFNWRRLIHGQNAIRAIRIANAEITVPTPPDQAGPAQFTASEAYATFELHEDGTIQVDRLTGVFCGIRLNVSGRIKPRAVSAPTEAARPAGAAAGKGQFLFVTKAIRELNRIQVTLPPQLDLDFDLDLARPLAGKLEARLRGSRFQYRGLQVDTANVNVSVRDGAVEIVQCVARLYGGEISANGRYDIAAGQFDLNLTSTTDPAAIVSLAVPDAAPILRELRWQENPTIVARYRLGPETGSLPELDGTVRTGEVVFRGVEFRSIRFAYENRGPEVSLSGVEVVTPEGQLTGQGHYQIESSDFTYQFDSTIDPTRLVPLMTPMMREIVEPAWFSTPPHIVAKVSGDFVDPDAFAYEARVDARRCSYRGVGLEGASATLRLRQSRLDVQELRLTRREGEVQGTILADFNAHRVTFDLSGSGNPSEMAGLLGEKAARTMTPYRFGPRTEANARGVIDFGDPVRTAWAAQVANEGFSYWRLVAARAQANLVFTNNTLAINDFDADLYNGRLRGRAMFAFSDAIPTYEFGLSAEGVDVRGLLSAVERNPSRVTGVLAGSVQIKGRGTDQAALTGKGDLEVTDGILWEAPLFGIFSRILGNTKATDARATVTIADKAVKTDDLQIAAGAFTARSHGQLGFDGRLDFRVEAQFLRAWPGIGWVSPIIGKLLEYKVGGTLGDPTYRAVNLPKELLPNK
jgi:hypothetical protein